MLKRSITIAFMTLAVFLAISYPVCQGRFISWKLAKAVEKNNVALLSALLDKGISADTRDKHGTPLLLLSVAKGHKEITKLLLDKGADVNIRDDIRDVSVKHPLIKGLGSVVFGGMTALQAAAAKGDKELVQLLIDNGADADISLDIIKFNAIDSQDEQPISIELGGTALHMALAVGELEIAKLLLPKTNNVNTVCLKLTPLHYAVMHGQADIVKSLLEKGANVNAVGGNFDATPLYFAVSGYFDENCPSIEIAEQLLRFGADPDFKNKNSTVTPLQRAYLNHCPELVELLLKYGADVNMRTKGGLTLLHLAVLFNDTMAELLLDHGIDVNAVNDNGSTALDLAIKKGYTDMAELLRKHGAKTSAERNAAE